MQNNFNAFWNIIKYINQNIDKIFDYDTDNDYSFLSNLRDFYQQKGDRISESEAKEYFKNFIKIDKYLVYHGEVSSSIEDFVLKIKNNLDAIDKLELSKDDIEEISLVLGDIGYDVKYNIYFNESKDPESVIEFGKPILVLNISSRVEKIHIEDLVDYLSRRDLEISNQYRLRDRTQYRITYKKYINRNNQEKLFVISSAANPLTESIDHDRKSKHIKSSNESKSDIDWLKVMTENWEKEENKFKEKIDKLNEFDLSKISNFKYYSYKLKAKTNKIEIKMMSLVI